MSDAPAAHRPPSPLLDLIPGAVEADAPDTGVAAHYGAISAEQRRFLKGDGFVDLSHRDVIAVTGPDRLALLHALTTQDFEHLRPAHLVEALVLSPQGRIEHGLAGVDNGSTFLAHTEPGAGPALVDFLERMKFMMRVDTVADHTMTVIATWNDGLKWRFVSRDQLTGLPERLGDPVGIWAYEALRIEAGIPRLGLDTDDRSIPNELGLLDVAVHLDKGCYRGQETVARVHNLGRPPRRLVRLLLDGSVDHLPAPGADVRLGETVVGRVGSTARHHELGPIALAVVKRNTPVTDDLVVVDAGHEVAAAQEVIVEPDTGLHIRPDVSKL